MDTVVIAGAADGDVATRIDDGERSAGQEGQVEVLVTFVLVAKELVQVVLVEVPGAVVPSLTGGDVPSDDARNPENQQHRDDPAAD